LIGSNRHCFLRGLNFLYCFGLVTNFCSEKSTNAMDSNHVYCFDWEMNSYLEKSTILKDSSYVCCFGSAKSFG
jgi:hypothetical protein